MGRTLHATSAALIAGVVLGGCTTDSPSADPGAGPSTAPSPSTIPSGPDRSVRPPRSQASPTQAPPSSRTGQARFDADAAMADVRLLAGRIGPRLATGPAYRRAGRVVEQRLTALGYDVRREVFSVPPGDSWGVPVAAGRSFNVVAEPPGFEPWEPHVVLGAHLDTVAVAPGAEDNASGVAVLLELARLFAPDIGSPRQPTVFVAFGAEEPRGSGDDLHHFGSQTHVRRLPPARRQAIAAMVSLDRVGVGRSVPVCTGPLSPPRVQRALLEAAEQVVVPAHACESTASDHWSFEKAGVTTARLGSTSYAAYHSAQDLPSLVDPRQLSRTGRLVQEWLR